MTPAMNRYTFVVQVHPDGISTLENLGTHERVQVSDLAAVGLQIERWLAGLGAARQDGGRGVFRSAAASKQATE
jgi:hypothetical protein